jgi:hypothetical protein
MSPDARAGIRLGHEVISPLGAGGMAGAASFSIHVTPDGSPAPMAFGVNSPSSLWSLVLSTELERRVE